uniref:Uncharacterized protein n=1 Tax=Glossina pallidipes TaxID=7398 RepID=A0A1A9ZAP1_GLOPL
MTALCHTILKSKELKERPQTDKMDKRKISLLYGTDSQSKRLDRYNGRGFLQNGASARAVDLFMDRRMDSPVLINSLDHLEVGDDKAATKLSLAKFSRDLNTRLCMQNTFKMVTE